MIRKNVVLLLCLFGCGLLFPAGPLCGEEAGGTPSSLAKNTEKNVWGKYYKLPKIKKKFAQFLKDQAQGEFLTSVR